MNEKLLPQAIQELKILPSGEVVSRWAMCPNHAQRSSNFQGMDSKGWLFRCGAKPEHTSHLFHAAPDKGAPRTPEGAPWSGWIESGQDYSRRLVAMQELEDLEMELLNSTHGRWWYERRAEPHDSAGLPARSPLRAGHYAGDCPLCWQERLQAYAAPTATREPR